MDADRPTCAECTRVHTKLKEALPCSQCPMPKDGLLPECATAYRIWAQVDRHDRQFWSADGMPLTLTLEAIRAAVRDYGLSMEMQELIVELEHVAVGLMQERYKKNNKAG